MVHFRRFRDRFFVFFSSMFFVAHFPSSQVACDVHWQHLLFASSSKKKKRHQSTAYVTVIHADKKHHQEKGPKIMNSIMPVHTQTTGNGASFSALPNCAWRKMRLSTKPTTDLPLANVTHAGEARNDDKRLGQ